MRNNKKAFTLVEMLVALAVSSIIIAATYASFELIQKQYKKSIDVAEMHTSGRSIMQILEREIRMAGYEFRDATGAMTYGGIVGGLAITDSGDACCDEITIIYDEVEDVVNDLGEVTSSSVERIQTRFWTEAHTSNSGDRFRLYKLKTILGRNNAILANPIIGAKEVMADYIEDLQIVDINAPKTTNNNDYVKIDKSGAELANSATEWSCVYDKDSGLIWEVKTDIEGELNYNRAYYTWYMSNPPASHEGQTGQEDNSNIESSQVIRNSEKFLQAVNSSALCGYRDWRLPEIEELKTIVKTTSTKSPSIDTSFFPHNPVSGLVITSDVVPGHNQWVLSIRFYRYGDVRWQAKSKIAHIRAVYKATSILKSLGITLTLRAKEKYGKTNKQFLKKDYHSGNFNFAKNDLYKRDTFATTVSLRNM
jgi:prepilin-type N-terminal cleavage/methylation domain-containing protein